MKQMGARNAGNPHVACDVEGAGDVAGPRRLGLDRRASPRPYLRGRGHSDVSLLPGEMVVTIAGKKHYLWRAVDQDGFVLEALVQSRRDKKAAKRLLRKLLKKQGRAPRVMVTDKLRSYGAAKKEIMPGVEH